MDKKIKSLFIILIIIAFASTIIPLGGVVAGIIAIVLFNYLKKNNILNLSNLDLEKVLKKNEEELKSIKDTKASELQKIEEFKKQYEILNDIMNLEDVKGKLQIKIAVLNDELKEVTNKINISEEILNYENLEKELYTFNNECDIIINKLTISNIDNSRKRLEAAKEQINKLVSSYYISINMDYFKLKVEELQLQYEYLVKIQEEREEQREIKERMREEAKVQAEINKLEKEAEKEEKMYQKALEKVRAELEKANDEEKAKLEIQVKNEKSRINGSENKSWICLCNIKYRFIW